MLKLKDSTPFQILTIQLQQSGPIQSVYTPFSFLQLYYFQITFVHIISATNIPVFISKGEDFLKFNYIIITHKK